MPDLTPRQKEVLGYICSGNNTIRVLAAILGTVKPNICRYVDVLVAARLVRRKGSGRSVLVLPTPAGRRRAT